MFAINTLAPFILNSKLKPRMQSPFEDEDGRVVSRAAFIVNVSAMEGKFYRHKAPTHPHTNMAKAALNMMTRTSAGVSRLVGGHVLLSRRAFAVASHARCTATAPVA